MYKQTCFIEHYFYSFNFFYFSQFIIIFLLCVFRQVPPDFPPLPVYEITIKNKKKKTVVKMLFDSKILSNFDGYFQQISFIRFVGFAFIKYNIFKDPEFLPVARIRIGRSFRTCTVLF